MVIFVATMGLSANLKTSFIDDAGGNSVFITQELPPGTSLAATDAAAKRVESVISATPGVETYQLTIGSQAGQRGPGSGTGSGTNTATYNITTDKDSDTKRIQDSIRGGVAKLGDVGEVEIGAAEQGGASSEVGIVVTAPDPDALRTAADQVLQAVRSTPGLTEVSSDLTQGSQQLTVRVDQQEAAERGLTEAQIGQAVRAHTEGEQIVEAEAGGTTRNVILKGDEPTETV
jgi:hydrophobic/amphiphilic exporter-1 (mainly G- bacteria), HAE1 family